MKDFVKRMIEEHAQLIVRISALDAYVYGDASNKDDKVEFANKCIQLSAMKRYEEALRARLKNQGIVFKDGKYLEHVGEIKSVVVTAETQEDENANTPTTKEE